MVRGLDALRDPLSSAAVRTAFLPLCFLALLGACAGPGEDARPASAAAAEVVLAPAARPVEGVFTDSAARAAELSRFRAGLPRVTALRGEAPGAESLVSEWVRAVEARDTAAIARLVLARDEFAWLYYPHAPLARPPYDMSPAEMWFLQEGNSAKGLREVLEKRGGRPLGFQSFRCDAPVAYGPARFHGNCLVRREAAHGGIVEERLFGALLELGGRWKFVSLSARL
jgi:hypothetical protein